MITTSCKPEGCLCSYTHPNLDEPRPLGYRQLIDRRIN